MNPIQSIFGLITLSLRLLKWGAGTFENDSAHLL